MLVPWSYVRSWECLACGHCCKDYAIPLERGERLGLASLFGPGVVERVLGKDCLKRGEDGRCVFQRRHESRWLCAIQGAKPLACRLFPFKVSFQPLFGRGEGASFPYPGRRVFVYADSDCRGIEWGRPEEEFARKVVPEFVRLKLEGGGPQFYSTARVRPHELPIPVRSIFSACANTALPLAVMA
ncbi:MAG: YkgJ family cysteine cluster protein [Thermoproteota archaeon]